MDIISFHSADSDANFSLSPFNNCIISSFAETACLTALSISNVLFCFTESNSVYKSLHLLVKCLTSSDNSDTSSDLLSKCPYLKQEKGLTDEGLEVNF